MLSTPYSQSNRTTISLTNFTKFKTKYGIHKSKAVLFNKYIIQSLYPGIQFLPE